MERISETVARVLRRLFKGNREVVNDNDCSQSFEETFQPTKDRQEVQEMVDELVSEDEEGECWTSDLTVRGTNHQELQDIISSLFGEPTHPDKEGRVNNWTSHKDHVLVVQENDSISFTEYYRKVSRKIS